MKVTISYDDPREAFLALNAPKLGFVITTLDERLRQEIKHGDVSEEVKEALQEIRALLHDECGYNGVAEELFG